MRRPRICALNGDKGRAGVLLKRTRLGVVNTALCRVSQKKSVACRNPKRLIYCPVLGLRSCRLKLGRCVCILRRTIVEIYTSCNVRTKQIGKTAKM